MALVDRKVVTTIKTRWRSANSDSLKIKKSLGSYFATLKHKKKKIRKYSKRCIRETQIRFWNPHKNLRDVSDYFVQILTTLLTVTFQGSQIQISGPPAGRQIDD